MVVGLVEGDARSCRLQFDIVDTGIGMTAEDLEHVFEPFMQADVSTTRLFGGTGLGLSICRRLAEMLGGTLIALSTPGEGSTFTLTLPTGALEGVPLRTSPAEAVASVDRGDQPVSRAADDTVLAGRRILLAEDGPDNQRVIRHVLERAGYEVTVAENGLIGVELALAAIDEGTPFSVVLMDVQMPVLDGYAATRQLRDQGYTGPIIALTAHALPSERDRCIEAGCDAFATKPIERVKLLETIALHLQKA